MGSTHKLVLDEHLIISTLAATDRIENINRVHPETTLVKLFATCVIMFLTGSLGFIFTFCLIITSDDVVGLVLDFPAVEFVGLIDKVGFGLT